MVVVATCRDQRCNAAAGNYGDLMDQVGRERGKSIISFFCPPEIDRHMSTFDEPGVAEPRRNAD